MAPMRAHASVAIANYKQDHLLPDLIKSIDSQTYKNIETVIFTDTQGIGTGEAFNRAIEKSNGDVVILMCADDVFTDPRVVEDIMEIFTTSPDIRHVSRWYHQFVDGDRHPVRAWRGDNVIELANNPSGLAFRKSALNGHLLSNKMFVEASTLVKNVCAYGWYSILEYDTVAVRVHKSIARSPEYYKKMWKSSPVEEWSNLGWKFNDYTHLIQVANYFERKAVFNEIRQFVRIDYRNLFNPSFWFFSIVALVTPKWILFRIPEIYRATWGRLTTREVKRP